MDRKDIIKKIITKTRCRRYLEIGVSRGDTFFGIVARHKSAVDPSFQLSRRDRWRWMIKNPYNIFARYYETTSDLFFADAQAQTFDVIFVDGLHTYAQALHDATNALNHLSRKGVLVMHDCSPPHNAAAFPAASAEEAVSANVPGWTGEWCGDVWKAICHLRSQRTDLQIFVLDCDYGVGVVRFGVPEAQLVLTTEGIDTMTYVDLERDRERLLNLKPENYLSDFLGS